MVVVVWQTRIIFPWFSWLSRRLIVLFSRKNVGLHQLKLKVWTVNLLALF